ncbi:MAG: Rab family GTPase [Promethearchaeota archaeon]
MSEYDYTFKVIMLGDASVGKNSLILRYAKGFFMEDLKLTIGVDFYSKTIFFNDKKIKLRIWNFGGEERFRFLLSQYSKNADGAFFLYDITNPQSIAHLLDWVQLVRENLEDIPIMLVGNKVDLEEFRAVSREEGILAAKKYKLASFVEISVKTGKNVENAFNVMTEIMLERERFR